MKKMKFTFIFAFASFVMSGAFAQPESYPSKTIRLIVPAPPGGGTDISARVFGQKISEYLGQQVIIENKLGANGVVGVDFASKAAPDGYTILVGSTTTMAANNFMYKNPTVDPLKDFLPVSILGTIEFAMLVPASSNYNSLKDLIGAAKANPGKLSYGFGSSAALLCGEMFNAAAGIQIVKVPYKGTPQSLIDLAADRIQLVCEPLGPSLPLIKSGKLRPLAVTSVNRHGLAPEVPTMAEAGLPMEHATWAGFFVPAKTPKEIVTRLSNEIVKIMGRADAQEKIRETGFIPRQIGSDEFGAVHRNDYSRMERIIKQAGITPD